MGFMKKYLSPTLSVLSWILFVLLMFYWFKDNIPPLKPIPGSPLLPFLLLGAVGLARIVLSFRNGTLSIRFRPERTAWILAAILLLAVLVRFPFLIHGSGILTSDDAIPALMGKHIAEGKVPPISYYGQLYLGSTTSHVFGLAFKCFGYSIFVLLSTTLLFYLGFIAVQFVFLKEIFSLEFAVVAGLFYSLPIGDFDRVSIGDTAAYPLVLLLGATLLFLSYRIAWKKEERWLGLFGFLSGIAFWTHQAAFGCILTAWLAVLLWRKPSLKRMAVLICSALVGLFPLLMQEVYDRFHMARFLTAGKMEPPNLDKLAHMVDYLRKLLSSSRHPLAFFFVLLLFAGFGILVVQALRKREDQPRALFALFFALFFGLYLFSGFSNRDAIRYLYPSYICLPILLFGGLWLFRSRWKVYASAAILLLLIVSNGQRAHSRYMTIKSDSLHRRQVVAAMEATGVKYWQANYWAAYALTAIAGEKVVVDAYTVTRYYPYHLDYFNQGRRGAFVFLKDGPETSRASALVELLRSLGVPFHEKDIDGTRLIYGLESQVFNPPLLDGFIKEIPPRLPTVRLEETKMAEGYLRLSFRTDPGDEPAPGFQVRTGIPPFSSQTRNLSPKPEDNRFKLALPQKEAFTAVYDLEYYGLKIPASVRTISLGLPTKSAVLRNDRIVFLTGIGPRTTFFGPEMKVLEKEVRIELNRLRKKRMKVRLALFSPLEFEHTFWYGHYAQRLKIFINGNLCAEKTLHDKDNLIEIDIDPGRILPNQNLMTLVFDYHLPLIFAPLSMTACLLESIAVEEDRS